MNISTPWLKVESDGNRKVFKAANTPAGWTSRIAVGAFTVNSIEVAGSHIRLAVTGSLPESQRNKLTHWITEAANAVGRIYGRYPQNSPQILVVPIGPRSEAVPWAHVMRGGGVSAEFFVDETKSLENLTADWTACHELSHMLLPFVSSRDRWLSEGLASYYQYVLLARSGMRSEQQAWQGLFEGFKRGENDTGRATLAEATSQGREYTMRVYWSGAAIMLMADTRLRADSNGRQSLDSALAELQECCPEAGKRWRADELFLRLDRITGTKIFPPLVRKACQ